MSVSFQTMLTYTGPLPNQGRPGAPRASTRPAPPTASGHRAGKRGLRPPPHCLVYADAAPGRLQVPSVPLWQGWTWTAAPPAEAPMPVPHATANAAAPRWSWRGIVPLSTLQAAVKSLLVEDVSDGASVEGRVIGPSPVVVFLANRTPLNYEGRL